MLFTRFRQRTRRSVLVERLRGQWGKPRQENNEIEKARKLDEALGEECGQSQYRVDSRTWPDLDMPLVFETVDRTLTPPGAQCLYRRLATPWLEPEELERREQLCSLFGRDEETRLGVQVELSRLSKDTDWDLPRLLWTALPKAPAPLPVFQLLSWALVATIALGFWNPVFWLVAFVFLGANVLIDLRLQNTILPHLSTLGFLGRMLTAGRRITELDRAGLADIQADLRANLAGTSAIANKTFLLELQDPLEIFDYVRTALLRNTITFFKLRDLILEHQPALRRIYRDVGTIDVAQSVASFRAQQRSWCVPVFKEGPRGIVATNVLHPAVADPIGNDVVFANGRSLLVTGSNMSGKSTLLKAVGVNAVLAQTIFTACAESYETPFVRVMSSVDVLDDLRGGKSYYFDEVESVLRLVNAAGEPSTWLFVVDELFRGTNPVERVAAATEVLHYLARQHIVLAATHDLEICELVASAYDNVHFREHITEDGVEFDYVLRPGPCTSRNAIELLRYAGFPESIVNAAAERVGGGTG